MTMRGRAGIRRHPALGMVLVGLLVFLAGCSGNSSEQSTAELDGQIAAFISEWQQLNPDEAARLTSDPSEAALMMDDVTDKLRPDSLSITTGPVALDGTDAATVTATFNWQLPDAGTWSYPATWTWERPSPTSAWTLDWSPKIIHPELSERQTLAVKTTAPEQGVTVDRNDTKIVAPVKVYSVVLMPAQVTDLAATAAALAAVLAPVDPSITADSLISGAAAAMAEATTPPTPDAATPAPTPEPTEPSVASSPAPGGSPASTSGSSAAETVDPASIGYTVINIREPEYLKLKPQLDAIQGLKFPSEVRDLPPTKDFARALMAEVTPAIADRVAGTAGWSVIVVDTTGGVLQTLADHPGVTGQRVTLTLDSKIQQNAEAAIAGTSQPAVLLAMQASTGEILAVAQNSAANALGDPALTGLYPPGSSFKIVSATAGLLAGVIAPGQPIDCPGTATFDGRLIRNHINFALGTVDSTLTFAKSCNTTFAAVAAGLPPAALPDAASSYGLGLDFVVDGITTLTGKIPVAPSTIQKAENGFGQGEILVTPFGELLMAATAAHGTMPMPILVRGTTTTVDKPAPARPAKVQQDIQTYMRAVVTEGTATELAAVGDVHAKTGTAEYVAEDGSVGAHVWNVGYRGDLAYVAMIVGGGDNIFVNQVALDFLQRTPE
ncbi:MAG: penicillin-binding transpeptidase domain-containing protein [Nakamurella sp.]